MDLIDLTGLLLKDKQTDVSTVETLPTLRAGSVLQRIAPQRTGIMAHDVSWPSASNALSCIAVSLGK